jgi:hypothetical protein
VPGSARHNGSASRLSSKERFTGGCPNGLECIASSINWQNQVFLPVLPDSRKDETYILKTKHLVPRKRIKEIIEKKSTLNKKR